MSEEKKLKLLSLCGAVVVFFIAPTLGLMFTPEKTRNWGLNGMIVGIVWGFAAVVVPAVQYCVCRVMFLSAWGRRQDFGHLILVAIVIAIILSILSVYVGVQYIDQSNPLNLRGNE